MDSFSIHIPLLYQFIILSALVAHVIMCATVVVYVSRKISELHYEIEQEPIMPILDAIKYTGYHGDLLRVKTGGTDKTSEPSKDARGYYQDGSEYK